MKRRMVALMGMLGLGVLLAGCQTVMPDTGYVAAPTIDASHPRARLILGSERLVDNIRMANVKFRKVGNFTQAQIGIQNLSDARYNLEYKIEWEDESGFMVDQSGVWRRFTLAPAQIDTVTATGKVPEAEKIVFTLRLPDDPFIVNKDRK